MTGAPMLTPAELAELVRRSPGTLRNWRYRGEGPAYTTAGGRVRYARPDVEAWLASHRVTPAAR